MISYCSNIYPACQWQDIATQLDTHLPKIQELWNKESQQRQTTELGLGLWLPQSASEHLYHHREDLLNLKIRLKQFGFGIETCNAFPYGSFHGQRIKEKVFQPDWSTHERLHYTCQMAEILAYLSDSDQLSISTLPLSYSGFQANRQKIWAHLEALVRHLHYIKERTGKCVRIGFEPEPFGMIDHTWDTIEFFNELKNASRVPHLIEEYLGITYDTCHFALQGETSAESFQQWSDFNIPVVKIQFSNALKMDISSISDLENLMVFDEPTYFHQTRVSNANDSWLFPDLHKAFEWAETNKESVTNSQWVIHYHIPLHTKPEKPLDDTSEYIKKTIDAMGILDQTPHLEVETYTWEVLPEKFKTDIDQQIVSELSYVDQLLQKPLEPLA